MYESQLHPAPAEMKARREDVSGLLGECKYGLFMSYNIIGSILNFFRWDMALRSPTRLVLILGKAC